MDMGWERAAMNESPDRRNPELSVTNFGPIARAEIDLRPMTVFVGPSNTGKSYLAILIYSLHRFFNGNYGDRRRLGVMSRIERRWRSGLRDLTDDDITRLAEWVVGLVSLEEGSSTSDRITGQLPNPVASLVRPLLRDWGGSGEEIADEVRRSFGVADTRQLVRHRSRSPLRVALKQPSPQGDSCAGPFEYDLTIQGGKPEFMSTISDKTPLYIGETVDPSDVASELLIRPVRHDLESRDDTARNRAATYLISRITNLVVANTVGPLSRVAHYLPADRTGIMHAHLVAVASVIERAPLTALRRDTPLPELSGVLADFLTWLVRLGGLRIGTDPSSKLAARLEEQMIDGAIHVEDSITGYPQFYYQPRGWKEHLPLMNTSSMVSELAPVVLYLRYIVQPGDVLIIEEPESHLHPAMQVEFVRHLAAAVRAGIRIMITTHSEWVLEELANLVRLSELDESRRQGIGGAPYALDPEQLGVWLFEPKNRPKGSVVKELSFDAEIGNFESGFDAVSMSTYNDYAEIASRIKEEGNVVKNR